MPEEAVSSMATSALHPPVEWAQRKDIIFVTIQVDDCHIETLEIQDDKLDFKGKGGAEGHLYEGTIEFYKPVDSKNYRRIPSDRNIQLVIPKKETGSFWPRLMQQKGKVHWIKIDFNKWKDEDEESDTERNGFDLNAVKMMGQMGGGDVSGYKPDLDDFEDSDAEDLPDLEDDDPKEETDKDKEQEGETTETMETSESKSAEENLEEKKEENVAQETSGESGQ